MTGNFLLSADSSRQVGEPLAGTAPHQTVWLLLEYREAWQAKATNPGKNNLNKEVADHIQTALNAVERSQLLFIRQQKPQTSTLTMFVIFNTESSPQAYRYDLESYADILDLPLTPILRGEIQPPQRHTDPIYTVCTHKERDRSCGQYGWAVYQEFVAQVGDQVWQSSHIGGHRFAGTVLVFPEGTCYGRMDPADVASVINASVNKEIALPLARGRTLYPKHIQAADLALREHLHLTTIDALRLGDVQHTDATWKVQMNTMQGDQYMVHVSEYQSEYVVLSSTGDPEPGPVTLYRTIISRNS